MRKQWKSSKHWINQTHKGGVIIEQQLIKQFDPNDMDAINSYARRPLTQEEVYQFNLILCDNEIDRDQECFTTKTLQELAPLFVGKTGIFDHDAKAEHQTARIYATQVVEDGSRTTSYGQPYVALHAKAYLIRSDKTQCLIDEIDGGIKKEVSIGCSIAVKRCSICGCTLADGGCEHRVGGVYEGSTCYRMLETPTDAYEWSFVAIPAQREAGVIKQFTRDLTAIHKSFFERDDGSFTKQELALIKEHWRTLEAEAEVGKRYRQELAERVVKLACICDGQLSTPMMRDLTKRMNMDELQAFEQSYHARLSEQTGLTPQLAVEQKQAHELDNNQSFKV